MTPGKILGQFRRQEFKTPDLYKIQIIDHAGLNKNLVEKISELENTIITISKKNWVERNPVAFAIILSVISALIAAIISQIAHIK